MTYRKGKEKMNIYEKLQNIKLGILEANLKKTGLNKFAGYSYYELSDILPTIVKLCNKHKVFTRVSYTNEIAELSAINAEKPDEIVTISSPMRELSLKGCNEIQSLGGIETYSRRYLYMSLFDIIENDMFDCLGKQEKVYKCTDCGQEFKPFTSKDGRSFTAGQAYHMAEKVNTDGKARCKACRLKREGNQC